MPLKKLTNDEKIKRQIILDWWKAKQKAQSDLNKAYSKYNRIGATSDSLDKNRVKDGKKLRNYNIRKAIGN